MNYLTDGVRGISLIVKLNNDRILFCLALVAALAGGAYFAHP